MKDLGGSRIKKKGDILHLGTLGGTLVCSPSANIWGFEVVLSHLQPLGMGKENPTWKIAEPVWLSGTFRFPQSLEIRLKIIKPCKVPR